MSAVACTSVPACCAISRGALAAWVADPHSVKPGVRMPASADMDGATLRALAAYLEQLK
jgi:cytochrome c oxidase subunit 2